MEYNEKCVINTRSGKLNLVTGECYESDTEIHNLKQLSIYYNKDAYDNNLDLFLNRVFCNDKELRNSFEEFIGFALCNFKKYNKALFFLGDGANGKSTLLNFMKNFFGKRNTMTLSLRDFNDKNRLVELKDKMINISDEFGNNNTLKLNSNFKKIVIGEPIKVKRNYEESFILKNKTRLVFACNSMPAFQSDTYTIIPMNAVFKSTDKDFDPFILEKITTDNAKSYMLNLALRGIQRVIETKKGV